MNDTPTSTTPNLSMLEKVLLLEAVMHDNRCDYAMCADWNSEHCVCCRQFKEIVNG